MNGIISMKIRGRDEGDLFLLCDNDGQIVGLPDLAHARRFIQDMYGGALGRSIEGATSAAIHLCEMEYRIHEIEDVSTLVDRVIILPFNITRISSSTMVGGRMGVPLLGPDARSFHESGEEVSFPPSS